MTIIEEIKQNIQELNWTAELKHQFSEMLASLGQNTLKLVQSETSTVGADLIGKYLVESLEKSASATAAWKSGNSQPWLDLASSALEEKGSDFGRYYIGPILDAKHLWKNGSLPPEIAKAWIVLEMAYFLELPETEFIDLISRDLLTCVQIKDFLAKLKIYFNERIPRNSPWISQLIQSLIVNEEKLGNGEIKVDNKEVPSSVRNWLNDYSQSSSASASERGTFEEVQYLKNSPNIANLTKGQQDILLDVIKIYDWLSNPVTSSIENYENTPNTSAVEFNKNIQDNIRQPEAIEELAPAEQAIPERPTFNLGVQPSESPINLQDILRANRERSQQASGIVSQGPAPVSVDGLSQEMEARRRQAQERISKKLEELKNKTA